MFILISWLFFAGLVSATPPSHQFQLDGSWYHKKSNNWIEIRDEGRYISVMGLPPQGKVKIFEKQWKDVYVDKKGNKISIESPHLILYLHRSSGNVISFERPAKAHGTHNGCDDANDSRWYDRNDGYNSGRPKPHHGSNDTHTSNNRFNGSDLEGTWQAPGGTDIAMVVTRDGLKAKYSGTTRWVDYRSTGNKGNEFEDDKGNRYIFHSASAATWYPSNRSKDPIELKKTDNQVKY